jgi:hypothetical protein
VLGGLGHAEAIGSRTRRPEGEDRQADAGVATYRRREPEKSLLHETVREHLETFLAEFEQDGRVRCTACGALLKPRLDELRGDARPPDALAASQAESISVLRGKPPDAGQPKQLAAYHQGFSLHAGVHLHANNREGLAHLCGYGARPPFAQERLSALPDGKLAYHMKRQLGDGREVLVLEPRELLRRLATLVPPPRAHLVRYQGVFGPASSWRAEVVPAAPPPVCPAAVKPKDAPVLEPEDKPPRRPDSRIPWSELPLRVFREDILACPCGGRRKVIAFISQRPVIEQILSHLGLPTTGPPTAPARYTGLDGAPCWQDDVPELQQSLR